MTHTGIGADQRDQSNEKITPSPALRNERLLAPQNALDVAIWARLNKILVLPGIPKEKKPQFFICGGNVFYYDLPPKNDSYHVPTPERELIIREYWKEPTRRLETEKEISIAFDTDYPAFTGGEGVFDYDKQIYIAALDLDSNEYYDQFVNHPLIKDWPVVTGKKGAKAFVKINYGETKKPENWAFLNSRNEQVLEVLVNKKLAFIYGEHPDSTPEKPIHYKFIRGFELKVTPDSEGVEESYTFYDEIPTISFEQFTQITNTIAEDLNLVSKQRDIHVVSEAQSCKNNLKSVTGLSASGSHHGINDSRVGDFLYPKNATRCGDELRGAHPIHGSTTGMNFHLNDAKNEWHCFRCNTGGGPFAAAAVASEIVDCCDIKPGWATPEVNRVVVKWLIDEGYIKEFGRETKQIVKDRSIFNPEVSIWD